MTTLHHQIGRPYWQGFEAPSTAHLTTDLVALKLGGGDLDLMLADNDDDFPDVLDVLVEIVLQRTPRNPQFTHKGIALTVFGNSLKNYNVETLQLQSTALIRLAGFSQKSKFTSFSVSHNFMIHPDGVQFDQVTALGGYWHDQADLSELGQYHVTFYEADDEIRYHLKSEGSFLQQIRNGQLIVRLILDDSNVCEYHTVDLVRHGTTTAWLTLRKR